MAEAVPATVLPQENECSDECSVCVAVHVRPLIDSELLEGCDSLLTTTPQQPQVCKVDLLRLDMRLNSLASLKHAESCRSSLGLTASHTTTSSALKVHPLSRCTVNVLNLLSMACSRDTTLQVNLHFAAMLHAGMHLLVATECS